MRSAVMIVLAAALAVPVVAQDIVEDVGGSAYLWTQQSCQGGECKTVVGGSAEAIMAPIFGVVRPFLRVDLSGLPERGLDLKDIGTWSTLETYGGVVWNVIQNEQIQLGPAVIVGIFATLDPEQSDDERATATPYTAVGGGRLGWKGGYLYAAFGKHEAAGPGTRIVGSVKTPSWRGFSLRADGASGEGGFVRYGVVWQIPKKRQSSGG